jgi:hypothetical protein
MRCLVCLVLVLAACGASNTDRSGAHNAAERARREQAQSGEKDVEKPAGVSWGGWRYEGAREDCFFVVGRKCFDKEETACEAARCKEGCEVEGGGPATIKCK